MPKYFFHQHLNGRLIFRDGEGIDLVDQEDAIEHAVHLISTLLAEQTSARNVRSDIGAASSTVGTNITHLSVEISNGTDTLSIVRGKVYVEHPAVRQQPGNDRR